MLTSNREGESNFPFDREKTKGVAVADVELLMLTRSRPKLVDEPTRTAKPVLVTDFGVTERLIVIGEIFFWGISSCSILSVSNCCCGTWASGCFLRYSMMIESEEQSIGS